MDNKRNNKPSYYEIFKNFYNYLQSNTKRDEKNNFNNYKINFPFPESLSNKEFKEYIDDIDYKKFINDLINEFNSTNIRTTYSAILRFYEEMNKFKAYYGDKSAEARRKLDNIIKGTNTANKLSFYSNKEEMNDVVLTSSLHPRTNVD